MANERRYHELVRDAAMFFPKEQIPRLGLGAMWLAEETGEVISLIRRASVGKELDLMKLREELGDVLWVLTLLADSIGASPSGLAFENILKLHERHPDHYPNPLTDVVVRL